MTTHLSKVKNYPDVVFIEYCQWCMTPWRNKTRPFEIFYAIVNNSNSDKSRELKVALLYFNYWTHKLSRLSNVQLFCDNLAKLYKYMYILKMNCHVLSVPVKVEYILHVYLGCVWYNTDVHVNFFRLASDGKPEVLLSICDVHVCCKKAM